MTAEKPDAEHFNQKPRRNAEFIKPINVLKSKVGYGGLSEDILSKAQALLENNSVDFLPMAEMYLSVMMRGIERAGNPAPGECEEALIAGMLYPAMQLKANGGMFRYPLMTRIAKKLIQFLEVIAAPDQDAIEIVLAFHTTMRVVLMGRVIGSGGKHGDELMQALEAACLRYFEHYPDNRSGRGDTGTDPSLTTRPVR
jgi:hypothetical protein